MDRKYKARVYSLLVFPGAGHFVLHRWWRGLLFAIPAVWGLVVLIYLIVSRSAAIFDQVLAGTLNPDFASLYEALDKQYAGDALAYNTAVALLVVTWILAAADVWVIGNQAK